MHVSLLVSARHGVAAIRFLGSATNLGVSESNSLATRAGHPELTMEMSRDSREFFRMEFSVGTTFDPKPQEPASCGQRVSVSNSGKTHLVEFFAHSVLTRV